MEFKIDCRLAYHVTGPASFLFNVAAVRNSLQRVRTENLSLIGAQAEEESMPTGQRLQRVTANNVRLSSTTKQSFLLSPRQLLQRHWTWRHWTSFLPKPWYSFFRAVSANQICWPVSPIASLITSNPVLSGSTESQLAL